MKPKTLQFLHRGKVMRVEDVPADRTLLELLREDLHCTGTKEGCGEGDCGACTVVVAEPQGSSLRYRAINSCIRLAHSIDGMALWTVEDLACLAGADAQALHPVQQAMRDCHASQCGFCTPGFVMSLFALYQTHTVHGQPIAPEQAQAALSGNLCRCTGYRPILDAAQAMQTLPVAAVDEPDVLSKLKHVTQTALALQPDSSYMAPTSLSELLAARQRFPKAQLVAGGTDAGLWITKQHRQFEHIIDVTRVAELSQVENYPHHIAIGAAVRLTDAFAALVDDRPRLGEFARRFAGEAVRNSGTLCGNVANGSPIGDSMPLLIALGASVVLMRLQGAHIAHRELALEDLYTGYRQNVIGPDEVLAWVKVPKAVSGEWAAVYKVSKRFEDDISAICLGLRLSVDQGRIILARVGVGGVAATPVRARATEQALIGRPWQADTLAHAGAVLQQEFTPISDMRASATYRRTVLGHLLQRFWLEQGGDVATDLHAITASGAAA